MEVDAAMVRDISVRHEWALLTALFFATLLLLRLVWKP